MHRLLLTIYLLSLPVLNIAQEKIAYDTASVHLRKFSPGAIKNYKADSGFQYERVIEPPRSLWDRFWDWVWGKIGEMLSTETGRSTFKTILILVVSGIFLFFILKLSGMTRAGLFGKENKDEGLGYSVSDEDIHAIKFDEAIEGAINDRNFRFAVRLLYLQSLKKLADLRLINWQVNKTNIAYAQELAGSNLYTRFINLTFQFENNWYGDLPIEENEFHAVKDQFTEFNRQLN